jgi:hypothetical protein
MNTNEQSIKELKKQYEEATAAGLKIVIQRRYSPIREWATECMPSLWNPSFEHRLMVLMPYHANQAECPHIVHSTEGSSYCNLAESSVKKLQAENQKMREALERLKKSLITARLPATGNGPMVEFIDEALKES